MSAGSRDLLAVCQTLLDSKNQTDAHKCRAISTAYYALFNHVLDDATELLIGDKHGTLLRAKEHLKRSLSHKDLKLRCKSVSIERDFPQPLADFSSALVELQAKRHCADYEKNTVFSTSEAIALVSRAKAAMNKYDRVRRKHRVAFCVWVLTNSY